MRKKILVTALVIILVGIYFIFIRNDNKASAPGSAQKARSGSTSQIRLNNSQTGQYTIDNPDSTYYIVNKKRSLPSSFVPKNLVTFEGKQLRSDTANAMGQLFDAASGDGINFKVISGYRSYQYQQGVYYGYVKRDGQTKADTYSARPGHSEHQTGLAADVGTGTCDLSICFGDTTGGKWLVNNAYRYGFIIRYPKDKENLTGYQYEPWHIRYLGIDLAAQVHKSGKTLEQFFALPPATDY
jgi:D-alanyl-D-alanine carboxypeptidase